MEKMIMEKDAGALKKHQEKILSIFEEMLTVTKQYNNQIADAASETNMDNLIKFHEVLTDAKGTLNKIKEKLEEGIEIAKKQADLGEEMNQFKI